VSFTIAKNIAILSKEASLGDICRLLKYLLNESMLYKIRFLWRKRRVKGNMFGLSAPNVAAETIVPALALLKVYQNWS
jgi:hypothetical protein